MLEYRTDELCDKAEATNTMKYVLESNALRKSAKQKKQVAAQMCKDIKNALKELEQLLLFYYFIIAHYNYSF